MVKKRTTGNFPEDDSEASDIEEILKPLRDNIKMLGEVLDRIEKKFDDKFKRQTALITNLMTRVSLLEKKG